MRRPAPLLAALALLAMILVASPAEAAPGTWLSRINGFRAQNGLGALVEDPATNVVAQRRTETMAANNYLAHYPGLPEQLTTPWTRYGENIGRGLDEASLFPLFTSSSAHRPKLLGPYNAVGIGQVFSGGRVWTTHIFLQTSAPLGPPPPAPFSSPPPPPPPTPPPPVRTVTGASRATGGLWTSTNTGRVTVKAGAPSHGQLVAAPAQPVVGMAATPTGNGYWLVGADGGIFAFGDASYRGSTSSYSLNQPIVGMTTTPSGNGYWLVAADGGIFAFGDATHRGSTSSYSLNQPIVGMTATPTGNGYWLVGADGGVFAFGDAPFYGSAGNLRLESPITGVTRSTSGRGYRMVASDGGIFSYGDAAFYGSLGDMNTEPVVAMAATPSGNGYWLIKANNVTWSFGDAPWA